MAIEPRSLVVESMGTFFLVVTVGMVVIDPGAAEMGPLAIGSVWPSWWMQGVTSPEATTTRP